MKKKNSKKSEDISIGQKRRMAAKKYADMDNVTDEDKEEVVDKTETNQTNTQDFSDGHKVKKKKKHMTKKRKIVLASVISAIVIVAIIVTACAVNMWKKSIFDYDSDAFGEVELDEEMNGVYTCLLVATDRGGSNTDTIMLAVIRYDDVNKIDLISIPRDTRVVNPNGNGGYVKINSIMARNGGKINALVSEVRRITGIPINDFILIDIEGVKKSVDLFGGVDFDVPMDMDYEDGWQNLYIHLKKGPQKIDGDKAEQLLRFRYGYPDADLGRTKVQREFMMAAFKQHAKVSNLGKLKEWFDMMGDYIQTQVTYEDAYRIAKVVTKEDFAIDSRILPGTVITGSPDYFYDAEEINEMAKELGFGENKVEVTPNPKVNSSSGKKFDSNDGPASTILPEVPAETPDVTAKPQPSDTPANSPDNTAEPTQSPNKSPEPTHNSGVKPTDGTPSESERPQTTSKPVATVTPAETTPVPTVKPSEPEVTSKPSSTQYPDGI